MLERSRAVAGQRLSKSAGAILSNRPVPCLSTTYSRSGGSASIKRSYWTKFARVRVQKIPNLRVYHIWRRQARCCRCGCAAASRSRAWILLV